MQNQEVRISVRLDLFVKFLKSLVRKGISKVRIATFSCVLIRGHLLERLWKSFIEEMGGVDR